MVKRKFFDFRRVPERRRAMILACMLFWSVLSYLAVSHFLIQGTQVQGISMLPTLEPGDRLVMNRLLYRLRRPRRGEIVAVHVPRYEDTSVKRIIALPNETIQFKLGLVYVNGRLLPEPYLHSGTLTHRGALTKSVYRVAPGCYFVMGDNRERSMDSRLFGAVARPQIQGRIVLHELATASGAAL